jgi:hypothetical protein
MNGIWKHHKKSDSILWNVIGLPMFVFFFILIVIWHISSAFLWGVHATIFGETATDETARKWAIIPVVGSTGVLIIVSIGWTVVVIASLIQGRPVIAPWFGGTEHG